MLQSVVLGIDWFVPCQLGLSFPHIGKSSYVEVLWHSDGSLGLDHTVPYRRQIEISIMWPD